MASKKERDLEKRETLFQKSKGSSGEPVVTEEDYSLSIAEALNWYTNHHDNKAKKLWSLQYFKKQEPEIYSLLKDLEDYRFMQLGSICRIVSKGNYLSPTHLEWMKVTTSKLCEIAKGRIEEEKEKAKTEPKKYIPNYVRENWHSFVVEIDALLDYIVDNKFDGQKVIEEFDIKAFIANHNISPRDASKLASNYIPLQNELTIALAGKEPDFVEAYSYFKKSELKKFSKFVDEIVDGLSQVKVARKPRTKKQKTPSQLVRNFVYQKEDSSLALVSEDPKSIIGAKEVWLYNVKSRKLYKYVALDKSGLTVNGRTIKNFDITSSTNKTIRKPETFFKSLVRAKVAMSNTYKDLSTKESSNNGRSSSEHIILKAF